MKPCNCLLKSFNSFRLHLVIKFRILPQVFLSTCPILTHHSPLLLLRMLWLHWHLSLPDNHVLSCFRLYLLFPLFGMFFCHLSAMLAPSHWDFSSLDGHFPATQSQHLDRSEVTLFINLSSLDCKLECKLFGSRRTVAVLSTVPSDSAWHMPSVQ